MQLAIRWMIKRDLDDVVAIERQSFTHPMTKNEIKDILKERNSIGMVVEDEAGVVLGWMCYKLDHDQLWLEHIVVHPLYVRHGIGSAMIDKLKSKLSPSRMSVLVVRVDDDNLAAHLFFAANDMRAIGVDRKHFDDGSDAYVFCYHVFNKETVR